MQEPKEEESASASEERRESVETVVPEATSDAGEAGPTPTPTPEPSVTEPQNPNTGPNAVPAPDQPPPTPDWDGPATWSPDDPVDLDLTQDNLDLLGDPPADTEEDGDE
jgi:hypothetical protein